METSGYVLVCESFEFEHDYKVIAFSKDSKSLHDYKDALESVVVQFSCQWSVLQKFLIRTRPELANFEIRSLFE